MATIPAALVMALREVTDLPIRDCRLLLQECGGDVGRVFDQMPPRSWLGIVDQDVPEAMRNALIARVNEITERYTALLSDKH